MTDRAYNTRPSECEACFTTWCWDGTDNTTTPSSDYAPVVGTVPSFITANNLGSGGAATGATNAVASSQSSSPAAAVSSSQSAAGAVSGRIGGVWGVMVAMVAVMAGSAVVLL